MTGYPWSTGDLLLANDLNAAINAASSGAAAGGPFLPLSGGHMQGSTDWPGAGNVLSVWGAGSHIEANTFWAMVDQTLTLNGAQAKPAQFGFLFSGNVTGTATANAALNYISVAADTATLPPGAQGLSWLLVQGNVGGGGSTQMNGNRAAIAAELSYLGPCNSVSGADRQWQAILGTFQSSVNAGGTAPHQGQALGLGYAGADQAWLQTGATNWQGLIGREIDVLIQAGASASARIGLHVASMGAVQGSDYDQGVTVSGSTTAAFLHAYALGTAGVDPTNGTVLGYKCVANTPEPPPKGYRGVDLSPYLFSDSAFRSAGGFDVDGVGAVNVSSAKLSVTNAGQAQLDVPGQAITAVAINSGGTGYVVGDQLRGPYGTVVTVSTISGGVITGITTNVLGGTTLAGPSTTAVPFVGGSGAGNATFNLTFTAAGGSLSLNPTGKQILTNLSAAATDAAAATAGVPIGGLYNNAGVVHVRLT